MMTYRIEDIEARKYEGSLILIYGDEVAERQLPLSRAEIAVVKRRREKDSNFIERFDRLPYHLYVVSFDSEKPTSVSQEKLRRAAAKLLPMLEADDVTTVAVTGAGTLAEEVVAMLEGLTLADYRFDRYRTKERWHLQGVVVDAMFLKTEELEGLTRLWNRIFWCREWVNLPVQDLTAPQFADELEAVAKDLKDVTCRVMDKRQIESMRMGGLLAVNRGSVDEPRFVVLEYKPRKAAKKAPICLVGKGVMYDTGGLNIKPGDYMQEMKSDMAGAATMASVLFAAADNALPVHLVALLPLTDSRPGFNAYASDDILTMYDGTTVEVRNTDAEGRLLLADAIAYAAKNYAPQVIIDAATLTGAAVRAISTFGIAVMQQRAEDTLAMLKAVGNEVYERLVEFPMWEEYDEYLKSDMADMVNSSNTPQAGTITAGKFLAHFAGDTPFVHLDIAGVAYFSKAQHCWAAGATGYGVRLLYGYMQMMSE
ncbi:MAG: peptidase M17 [Bacteroidales bacterium]|nr:peptidase M17 [Bacteroidales bacterium]